MKTRTSAALLVALSLLLVGGLLGCSLSPWLGPAAPATPTPSAAAPTAATPSLVASTRIAVSEESAIVDVVKRVSPAVVTVINTLPPQRGFFGAVAPEAQGSGVIIDPSGYIVTNNHVVEGSQALSVIMADGTKKPARLIGADKYSDLAVIKIEGTNLPTAELGESSILQPGQIVVAIGSALGDFRNTVTMGVVSGLDRSLDTGEGYNIENLIQTDAAINRGNSGGPLCNTAAQVIGINTAIIRSSGLGGDVAEGIGFAIPSDTVRTVADQLIRTGSVVRPYLGIESMAVTRRVASYYDLAVQTGILVTSVSRGTPADQAGLKAGDVILKLDNDVVDAANPLNNALWRHKPGDTVKLTINRAGRELTVEVTLIEQAG
ncbi:MAG: PDZ domain-containing protein [Chloroflexi bacterium]|nr:PDZ domain-containing protein [Chloroflexota bacterium]